MVQSVFMAARLREFKPGFCWQAKTTLRYIREQLDGDPALPSALGVYLALCENASDRGTDEFETLQGHLAKLAGGMSTRTVQRVLPVLREIGVIDYVTPKLRGAITYRLLDVVSNRPDDTTPCRNDTTQCRNVTTLTVQSRYDTVSHNRKKGTNQRKVEEILPANTPEGTETLPTPDSPTRKPKSDRTIPASPSEDGLNFATWFRGTLSDGHRLRDSWREDWGRAYDDLIRIDKRTPDEVWNVSKWARADGFWSSQFLSPLKLRKRNNDGTTFFDIFVAKMNKSNKPPPRRKESPI
jgi:hypothetical protein